MTEREIERLVVRLVGDGSSHQKMIQDAIDSYAKLQSESRVLGQAERQVQETMRQGAAITRSVETSTERYNRTLSEMSDLLQKGAISRQTFDRVMKQSENLLPEFADAQRRANEAETQRQQSIAQGVAVTRAAETELETYARKIKEIDSLLKSGTITQETYNRTKQSLKSNLPESRRAEANRQDLQTRGASITASVETEMESYARKIKEIDALLKAGTVTQETYNRARERLKANLPESRQAEVKRQQAVSRGEQVTQSVMTVSERHVANVKELNHLLKEGAISQQTYARAVQHSEQMVRESASALQMFGGKLMMTGGIIAAVAGTITASLTATGISAIQSAGKYEQTTIAFETMLGSAEAAKNLLGDLTQFAAKTPFEMPEIEQASRGLVQFGERGDELMETLDLLGNAAAGTSTNFGMVALIFNQVRGVGHLLTQDFRQLSTRGILSLQDIAKHYKITTEAAQTMLSEGKISFDDLKQIFRELSGEGGRFANLMERQSQSVLGKWSTLKDNFNIFLRGMGEQLLGVANKAIDFTNSVVSFFTNLSPGMKQAIAYAGLAVAAFGTLTAVGGGLLLTVGGLIASWGALATVLGLGTTATIMNTSATVANAAAKGASAVATNANAVAVAAETTAIVANTTATVAGGTATAALTGKTWAYVAGATVAKMATLSFWTSLVKTAGMTVFMNPLTLAFVALGVGISKAMEATKYLNKQMERSEELAARFSQIKQATTQKTIDSGMKIEDIGDRETFFKDQTNVATKESSRSQKRLQQAKEKVEGLDTWSNRGLLWENADLTVARQELKEAERDAKDAEKAVKELRDASLKVAGTSAINEEIDKVGKLVETYQRKIVSAQQTVKNFSSIKNPTEEQKRQFEEASKSVEEYKNKLGEARNRIDELTKLGKLKTTEEFTKGMEDLDKRLKSVGDPLKDQINKAREQKVAPELIVQMEQKVKQVTEHEESLQAKKSIEDTNKKYEEQFALVGKVGFEQKRAEAELLAMKARRLGLIEVEIAAAHQLANIAKEETLSIQEILKKQEKDNSLIGLKGVDLQDAQQKNQGTRGMTQEERDRAQASLNVKVMREYLTQLERANELRGLEGAALEAAKLKQAGFIGEIDLANLAFQQNVGILNDLEGKLTKQSEVMKATGFDAWLLANGLQKAGMNAEQLARAMKDFDLSKGLEVEDTIKKLREETAMIGKTTPFEQWQEKNRLRGITLTQEQITKVKTEFDKNDVAKLNEQFLPPVDKFKREMDRINELRKAGLNDDAYRAMRQKAEEEFAKSPGGAADRKIDFSKQTVQGTSIDSAEGQRLIAMTQMTRGRVPTQRVELPTRLRTEETKTVERVSQRESIRHSENLKNLEKVRNVENVNSLKQVERVKEIKNLEHARQVEFLRDAERVKNVENLRGTEKVKNLENIRNLDLVENVRMTQDSKRDQVRRVVNQVDQTDVTESLKSVERGKSTETTNRLDQTKKMLEQTNVVQATNLQQIQDVEKNRTLEQVKDLETVKKVGQSVSLEQVKNVERVSDVERVKRDDVVRGVERVRSVENLRETDGIKNLEKTRYLDRTESVKLTQDSRRDQIRRIVDQIANVKETERLRSVEQDDRTKITNRFDQTKKVIDQTNTYQVTNLRQIQDVEKRQVSEQVKGLETVKKVEQTLGFEQIKNIESVSNLEKTKTLSLAKETAKSKIAETNRVEDAIQRVRETSLLQTRKQEEDLISDTRRRSLEDVSKIDVQNQENVIRDFEKKRVTESVKEVSSKSVSDAVSREKTKITEQASRLDMTKVIPAVPDVPLKLTPSLQRLQEPTAREISESTRQIDKIKSVEQTRQIENLKNVSQVKIAESNRSSQQINNVSTLRNIERAKDVESVNHLVQTDKILSQIDTKQSNTKNEQSLKQFRDFEKRQVSERDILQQTKDTQRFEMKRSDFFRERETASYYRAREAPELKTKFSPRAQEIVERIQTRRDVTEAANTLLPDRLKKQTADVPFQDIKKFSPRAQEVMDRVSSGERRNILSPKAQEVMEKIQFKKDMTTAANTLLPDRLKTPVVAAKIAKEIPTEQIKTASETAVKFSRPTLKSIKEVKEPREVREARKTQPDGGAGRIQIEAPTKEQQDSSNLRQIVTLLTSILEVNRMELQKEPIELQEAGL